MPYCDWCSYKKKVGIAFGKASQISAFSYYYLYPKSDLLAEDKFIGAQGHYEMSFKAILSNIS